jgi:hypothetical protein
MLLWLRSWSWSWRIGPWGGYIERRISNFPQWGLQRENDAVILHIGKVRVLWGRTRGRPADGAAKQDEARKH